MLGIAAVSKPFVSFFLTDKWLPCVPYVIVFCITYAFYPLHTANLNAIKAIGRSDIYLRLTILERILSLVILVITMWFGPFVMAVSNLFISIAEQIINSWPNRKLLKYSYIQQFMDIMPSMVLSFIMYGIVWSVQSLHLSNLLTLFIQVTVGVLVYICLSAMFRLDSFIYLIGVGKAFIKSKKRI